MRLNRLYVGNMRKGCCRRVAGARHWSREVKCCFGQCRMTYGAHCFTVWGGSTGLVLPFYLYILSRGLSFLLNSMTTTSDSQSWSSRAKSYAQTLFYHVRKHT